MVKIKQKVNWSQIALALLPIAFLFVSVFVARSDVKWFYLLSIILIVTTALLSRREKDSQRLLAYALIVLACIGLSAASILTIEKIEILKDPQRVTSCSISPIVSCSPVIASPQASAFDHIPNPVFGIFGFAAVLTAGMTILAGARKLSRVWWLTIFGGILFGVGFCIWLMHAGLYEIGALCLYCMSVWMVTFSLFWIVLAELLKQKLLSIHKRSDSFIIKNRDTLITVTIGLIIILIYFRWSDYWNSLL